MAPASETVLLNLCQDSSKQRDDNLAFLVKLEDILLFEASGSQTNGCWEALDLDKHLM